ncbi:MAG: hypothetical protein M3004_13745, partial [Bacteroidota bacterium]|nr:hypothetical protein [Bacteroidota bacterium]
MKKAFLFTTLLVAVITIFSACSKSSTPAPAPSVVGTWEETSTHLVITDTLGGIAYPPTTKDSAFTKGQAPVIQFLPNNTYTEANYSVTPATNEAGNYSISVNTITLVPTSGSTAIRTGIFTVSNTTLT